MMAPGTQGEVSPKSIRENRIFGRREPARRETDLSPHYWEQCETKSAKNLAQEGRSIYGKS
jgi:hypothetical protein